MLINTLKNISFFFILVILLSSCIKFYPKSARDLPTDSAERARKNIEEGRGVSVGNILGGRKGTNYEFSSSNPMWRATLETIDFLPLSTVDYSGGLIISDWYSDNVNEATQIKITIRFLSNEISPTNLKIIVHKKVCDNKSSQNCRINIEPASRITEELTRSIVQLAAKIEKENKDKK